jgi:hypothetical protein
LFKPSGLSVGIVTVWYIYRSTLIYHWYCTLL